MYFGQKSKVILWNIEPDKARVVSFQVAPGDIPELHLISNYRDQFLLRKWIAG